MLAAILTGAGAAWLAFLLLTRPRGFQPAARMEAPLAAGSAAPRHRFDRRRAATWADRQERRGRSSRAGSVVDRLLS
jgi:hypothetical protein